MPTIAEQKIQQQPFVVRNLSSIKLQNRIEPTRIDLNTKVSILNVISITEKILVENILNSLVQNDKTDF